MNPRPYLSLVTGIAALFAAGNVLACEPTVSTKYFEDRAPGTNFKCIQRIVQPRYIEKNESIACGFQYTVQGVNNEKFVATFQASCGRNQADIEGAASEGAEDGGLFFFLTAPAYAITEGISSANINSKIGKSVKLACENQVETLKQLACDDDFEIVKPGTRSSAGKKASSERTGKRKVKGE
jgi:hypothetical protein